MVSGSEPGEAVCAELRAALGRPPRVMLVSANPNLTTFVSPYGLEVIGAALEEELGAQVSIVDPFMPGALDMMFTAALMKFRPDVIGVGFRNLDIAYAAEIETRRIVGRTCVPDLQRVLRQILRSGVRRDRVLLGGTGFSSAPVEILRALDMPYGIVGPGARACADFVRATVLGTELGDIPGLVTLQSEYGRALRPGFADWDNVLIPKWSIPHRQIMRDRGTFFPLRTTSGCGLRCSYCVEGRSQARRARTRPIDRISQELRRIQSQGAQRVMIADGEFNVLYSDLHLQVTRLLADAELSWRAYCLSIPPSPEMLRLIARSRCEGILLTFDTASELVHSGIGRPGTVAQQIAALDQYVSAGIPVSVSLLFGLPGETRSTIEETLALIRAYPSVMFTYSCGARIYPNTSLAERANSHPEHVYHQQPERPLGISVYCEPEPPWEVAQHLRDSLVDVDNASRFW